MPPTSTTACSACAKPSRSPGQDRTTLFYPKWLPGNHSTDRADRQARRAGRSRQRPAQRLEWQRDPVEMYAFHVDVPAGVTQLELQFEFVTPTDTEPVARRDDTGPARPAVGKGLAVPGGLLRTPDSGATRRSSLPAGWQFATALRGAHRTGDSVRFATVPLETLVDSPLFAGPHYRRVELDSSPKAPVRLNIFADAPAELQATDEQLEKHRRAVREAVALFGSRHFREYDFLLAISEHFTGIGLEHHESSENGVGLGYFTDWDSNGNGRDLLPHEMIHSWNGKFRRPADLWTPSYEVPMGTEPALGLRGPDRVLRRRARGSLRTLVARSSRATFLRGMPRTTTRVAPAGNGATCRTPRSSRSSITAAGRASTAGSAARITTPKASSSGWTSTPRSAS